MKKIMFNDKFLLTQACLEGRKTQTRRLIKCRKTFKGEWVAGFNIHIRPSDKKVVGLPCMYDADESEFDGGEILPKYRVGEVVAVAQSYKTLGYNYNALDISPKDSHISRGILGKSKGWNNKMFVRAEACKHQIRITDVRVEKLQEISDEDCIKEGVELNTRQYEYDGTKYYCVRGLGYWRGFGCTNFYTPREAFAALIDKVSGKGTWERNPYVFVYDFELVK